MSPSRDWVGAGAGFLFVLLTVVGVGVGGSHPSSIGPVEDIKSRFLADPGPFAIQAGSYIQAVATLPAIVFGVRIAQRLWLGGQQWVAAVALSGVVLAAGIGLVGVIFLTAGADLARTGFFRVQGDHWFYVLLVYSLWTLITSGILLTRQRAA